MNPERERGACPAPDRLFEALASGESGLADHAAHLARCERCASFVASARGLENLATDVRAVADSEPNWSRFLGLVVRDVGKALGDSPREVPVLTGLEIVRHLAHGGCADVWLARDAAGPVALKAVRQELAEHELAALKHYKLVAQDPRIGLLPILHITRCEASARLCYTMPLADPLQGRALELEAYEPATLEAVVALRGPLPAAEAVALAREILEGLGELHARGLVHRDVKPANLLRYHGRWCLADTGLLVREGQAHAGPGAGTPTFLPPEGTNDHRTADLFAFGKTLYFALTGGLSGFPAPTRAHLADQSQRALHRRLYRALSRACEPIPEERFQSAREMKRAIEGAPRRAFGGWSSLAAALVLALAILVWGARGWGREPRVRAAPATSEWEVARLVPGRLRSGEASSLWADPRLWPGSQLSIQAGVSPFAHIGLVLASYVGDQRSVQAYRPLSIDENGSTFGPALAEGRALSFELRHASPFLAVLFGSEDPWDEVQVEQRVETALEAAGGWPALRGGSSAVFRVPKPLVFHGPRADPILRSRGGPSLAAGAPVLTAEHEHLLAELREVFPAFDGFVLEVEP